MSETTELSALREQLARHEHRITELEIEAAFRRQTNDELDEVVRGQDQRITALERRITELLAQLPQTTD
ncbi:Protein SlyX [Enhygromyxa salina]|uniref:Protein SlyX n=1 Tax=Enhygromyxa salina TaxID=215803 RepID=A0A2S9YGR8_9BACT|nr:SlyX family protein [Enhygromyxa salina]PRQ04313.1 Protein SlyX [Enhygromyxa salina]